MSATLACGSARLKRQTLSAAGDATNNNEPPKWLVRVALATDEMVSVPEVMANLQEKVREWARIHAKSKDPVFPCFPHPKRAPTPLEEFALISAIHDRICTDATPINPWDGEWNVIDDQGWRVIYATLWELRFDMAYGLLVDHRVPHLRNCASSIVEGWFEHVRDGLGLAPATDDGRKPRRPHKRDSGRRINKAARRDLVLNFIRDRGGWDGTLAELREALFRERRLKVSESTLSRYLTGTRYQTRGNPHHAARAPGRQSNETEPVAAGEADDLSHLEAYTMPDGD